MGRVEDALEKLRAAGRAGKPRREADGASKVPRRPATPAPEARNKKVSIDGVKFHVSQEALVKEGVLAPLDHAIPVADEFRRIKRPLLANAARARDDQAQGEANVIMITSAVPGAGKTFCSVNLAASISLERELNVMLVDADVAKPHISRAFGLASKPGLIDLLHNESLDVSDLLVRTDLNDIQILPAGRGHPQATELLASERMSSIVSELSSRYADRIILLDSPPLLITSEAQALASQVGQIVLIVEAGRTSKQMMLQTVEMLDPQKAINMILNKSSRGGLGSYYGYGYYGYGDVA